MLHQCTDLSIIRDPLAHYREYYVLPENGVYLCTHSLGAMPKRVSMELCEVLLNQWSKNGCDSWAAHQWLDMPKKIAGKIAKLIGASASEVAVADSTSVNLYKLLNIALSLQSKRSVILTNKGNFPTDLYIAQGIAAGNSDINVKYTDVEKIMDDIDDRVAVVMLTQVDYLSSKVINLFPIIERAKKYDVLTLIDLSHSTGVLDINVRQLGLDMAVGCGYKYLNGGPGAPAYLYVASKHHSSMRTPIQGWMGHIDPFSFADEYQQGRHVDSLMCGTPAILSMRPLDISLDLYSDIHALELSIKNKQLTQYFIDRIDVECPSLQLESPRCADVRGGHVTYSHPQALKINKILTNRKIMTDCRLSKYIRFGFSPLYNNHSDIDKTVRALKYILQEEGV